MNSGKFQKGNIPHLKGKHHTLESRKKMSESLMGRSVWNKGKKEIRPEVLAKLSSSHIGQIPWIKGKKGFIPWNKNKTNPSFAGKNNPKWKGGITPINQKIRKSIEYKLWRKSVFERDNYVCIFGGKEHGKKIQADHIKPFALYPELRFAIDNGRTLCEDCHKKTDTWGNNYRDKKGKYTSKGRMSNLPVTQ